MFVAVGFGRGSGLFIHGHFLDVETGGGITECSVYGVPPLVQASPSQVQEAQVNSTSISCLTGVTCCWRDAWIWVGKGCKSSFWRTGCRPSFLNAVTPELSLEKSELTRQRSEQRKPEQQEINPSAPAPVLHAQNSKQGHWVRRDRLSRQDLQGPVQPQRACV